MKSFKRFVSLVTFVAMIITLSIIIVPFAADEHIGTENFPLSYIRYFSTERAVLQSHPATANRSYVVPFIGGIDTAAAAILTQDDSTLEISNRNIYMLCIENGTTYSELLFEGNYNAVSCDGDVIYAIEEGNKIYKLTISTGTKEFLYASSVPLIELYGFEDVVFFDSETTIYRLHIASGIVDSFPKPDGLITWKPQTNQTLYYAKENTFFTDCVEKEIELGNKEDLFDWLQTEYAFIYGETIPTESYFLFEPLNIYDFLFDILNVSSVDNFYYNFEFDSVATSYEASPTVIEAINAKDQEEAVLIEELREESYETHDIATPGISYSTGDHFSTNSSGCTCHGYSGSCDYWGGCDCLSFESAIQCSGYARYVYYAINGVYSKSSNYSSTFAYSLSTVNNSINTIAYFISIPKCAFVRFSNHSIAVTAADLYGITFSHANVGDKTTQNNRCRIVNNVYKTYASLAADSTYSTVLEARIPSSTATTHDHYYRTVPSAYDASTHYRDCLVCGAKTYENHIVNSAGTECIACGYTGPFWEIMKQ